MAPFAVITLLCGGAHIPLHTMQELLQSQGPCPVLQYFPAYNLSLLLLLHKGKTQSIGLHQLVFLSSLRPLTSPSD